MTAPALPAAARAPADSLGGALDAPAAVPPRERLLSLDAFRGLTVAAMLLVNNPGSSDHVYWPLRHAAWNGWTPTDLVFPFFLFIVGVTTHLSLSARAERGDDDRAVRRQVLKRGATIFLLGLVLNWLPFYQSGAIAGHASPNFFDRVIERLLHVRGPGVLQRIGIAYVAAALVSWRAPARRVVFVAAGLLLAYWAAMTLLPVPGEGATGAALLGEPARTLSAWVDRHTLDWTAWGLGNHLRDGGAYDPEGLLSTIPSVASVLCGVLAGRWLASTASLGTRLGRLAGAGAVAVVAGLVWGLAFPINKNVWTSSYALFAAGAAALLLAATSWVIDVRGRRRWSQPLVVYGSNPMVAFVGSEVLATVLHSTIKIKVDGHRVPATTWITGRLATGLAPANASLCYALLFVLLWFGVLLVLYRKRLFFKA